MGSTYQLTEDLAIENQAELYYKRSVGLQTRDGIELINKLSLPQGGTVLDLGCGTGNLTSVLADKVGANGHVIGIDPDRERIKVAKENNASNNITFVEADGETFPENQYNLVFSNYVLHWIEDKEAVFKRVYNNLHQGGQFVLTLCHAMPTLVTEIMTAMPQEEVQHHEQQVFFLSIAELEELAASVGFRVEYKDSGFSSISLPDFETAFEFVSASSNGEINLAVMNKASLDKLQKKYMGKEVVFSEEYATFILTKE